MLTEALFQACDWSALDRWYQFWSTAAITKHLLENLAAQRVRHLNTYVVTALAFGCLDPESRSEPLKVINVGILE